MPKAAAFHERELSRNGLSQLLSSRDQHRLTETCAQRGSAQKDHLFLSETRRPLTKNTLTLLFARLSTRAGVTEKHISPSMLRDTFAVCYLQAGGDLGTLQEWLGLEDPVSVNRYQHLNEQLSEKYKLQESPTGCATRCEGEVTWLDKRVQGSHFLAGEGRGIAPVSRKHHGNEGQSQATSLVS